MIKKITFEIEEDGEDRSAFLFLADMLEKLATEDFRTAIPIIERMAMITKSQKGMETEADALKMVSEGGRILLAIPHYARLRSPEEKGSAGPVLEIHVADQIEK